MSTAASPPFSIQTVGQCVVVLRMWAIPSEAAFPLLAQAYTRLYDKYAHLVVVFDLRGSEVPPLWFLNRVKDLLLGMKHRTCRQLLGAVVLPHHAVVRDIITSLVEASGQVAPFYVYLEPEKVARKAAQLGLLINGVPGVVHAPGNRTFGELSTTALCALMTVLFATRAARSVVKHKLAART